MSMQIQFIIFWIIILALLVLGTFYNRFTRKSQMLIVCIAFLVLSYLYSYRTLGLDLRNYISYYNTVNINRLIGSLSWLNFFSLEYEPLFTITIIIAKSIGLSANEWLFTIVLFPSMIFYYSLFKKSNNPLLLFYFFILIMMFQVDLSRFYLAAPFVSIAFTSKKAVRKIFFYMIAFGFHYSVAFLLIVELFVMLKISYRKKILCFLIIILGTIVFKNLNLSFLEHSEYRFLFKLWYNLFYANTIRTSTNIYQYIMVNVVNIYPTFMCIALLICIKQDYKSKQINKQNFIFDRKYLDCLEIGIIFSGILIILFGTVKVAFRTLLLTYFSLFIPICDLSEPLIDGGKISGRAIGYSGLLFFYNILMSMYYVLISIIY